MQSCARCGFVVYPAEKINCIDQNWHKACFHCDVCKMVLTANNFVSHKKRPYCSVHNPRNNTFTSVYETPININAKKQSKSSSELKYLEEGDRFMSTFHYDMKSSELERARLANQMASQAFKSQSEFSQEQTWYGMVTSQEMVTMSQAQMNVSDVKYTEEYEQSKGKGSFPALITPGYQVAKNANTLASDLEYKKGHEERVSKYTAFADPPEVLLAKKQGQIVSDYAYTEEYEQRKGKGSFPAHLTPGYKISKKASEQASNVRYRHVYEQEIKGKASAEVAAAEMVRARENADNFSQMVYTEEYEQQRGKGSFPAMITPGYHFAKKAQENASDLKYRKDLNKMKGSSHFHNLTSEDNLALMNARKINKLVSEVEYKKDLENSKGHSINFCETPQFQNATKVAKFTSDNKYKEKYTTDMKGHYEGSGIDKRTMHAMKARTLASDIAYKQCHDQDQGEYNYQATLTPGYRCQRKLDPLKDKNYRQHIDQVKYNLVADTPEILLARKNAHLISNLNYKADYEKTKHLYTLNEDLPQIKKAKDNAALCSDIKYKEAWEKTKSKACDIGVDDLSVKAAKASRDLASDLKYKENYLKNKEVAVGVNVSDSKTLHSLQVAKMRSDIAYKKGSKENQSRYSLGMDMVNLSHAKKAQALASDLEYRTRLHDYTVMADDIKVQQAKKAYSLQSENQYRSDLNWMKGVGWETEGCLDLTQAKKAGDLLSDNKYRQKVDRIKFTQVADNLSIRHAKKSQELQSDLAYKANTEQMIHQYTMTKDEPLFRQAKANAELLSGKVYKSQWEKQREKGFELRLDSLSILTARAKRDLASDVKYKEQYEKNKGKVIGIKSVSDDSQMAHSALATKLQSGRDYKKKYEDTKTQFNVSLDMLNISQAKRAQDLAADYNYRTYLHDYTTLPTDMKVAWAKKAYGLQSDKLYRSDLNWMKGVGWEASKSLDVRQAKKAGELLSEKKYRQDVSALKFTSVEDTPEMVQAKLSNKLAIDRLYREKGENMKHNYTLNEELPEFVQAKINATNLSESRYKESWMKLRDGGYKLRLDAIPFQSAKASADILSDQKYKEEFEKTKGKMIGLKGLQDDMNIAHSVYANKLQSDISYKKESAGELSKHHLPMDMMEIAHAKKAQSLVSDQDYRLFLHQYTSLPDDMKLQAAKKAYALQSERIYRSDLNYLRGAAWIATGALQIEGSRKATDLISDKKYRQQPYNFKHTSVADSPDMIHAKFSGLITNERLYKEKGVSDQHSYTITAERPEITQAKINAANFSEIRYRDSWHNLRAQGYKLTMQDIPFQAAKSSTGIASDYKYRYNHLMEKGKHIGAQSVWDDTYLLHYTQANRLASDQEYRKDALTASGRYHLTPDMIHLVTAKNAQALASEQDYRKRLHEYTVLPDDMKVKWAKKAYDLQSETLYKSDLNFMKGVAWDGVGAPQLESAKKAGALLSDKRYRQLPDSLKFTSVTDSPDMLHAKASYQQCSERLYKSGRNDDMNKYTLHPDDPDFVRAKMNAQHISDKVYKASGELVKTFGYDLRLDAIPFQTAKASREIASDVRYKDSHLREKGQQVGLRCVEDDPKMVHSLAASKLQSNLEYKRQSKEQRSNYKIHADQPDFLLAKKSQAQASDLTYRSKLHDYTCDSQQLNVMHAKRAYELQSDVNYKSDLNRMKGSGWTPPGSHKVELARRAAELGFADGVSTDEAIAKYQRMIMLHYQQRMEEQQQQQQQWQQNSSELAESSEEIQRGVNMDATEVLHVNRTKSIQTVQKKTTTTTTTSSSSATFKSMEKKSSSTSSTARHGTKIVKNA
ncbi:nebulin-related-anchoring protein isoform X1 [Corythoichthys intestinalis]|uniref:nebulin-related-anchoring protein isoform X1 n=1 Tax=Corythoichthys intestinalis TaxID=161448 RepID=UPI0025A66C64|nr:nebulin-related-anchoring protein isoform X1 [Corythoichthys intestinalis]XP_061807783.1 nebulin-related-anchoring protein-like [Nerophis lumbriciformis]